MPDQSVGARLWRLITVNWRELSGAWKTVVIAGAAVVLISCCGIVGALIADPDPGTDPFSPAETTTETETRSPSVPLDRPTVRPQPTQAPTTKSPSPSPAPSLSPTPPPATTQDDEAYYENCDAARADGAAPLYRDDPGYAPHLDADDDGVACEPYFDNDNDGDGGGNGDTDDYYENCDAARADGAAPLHEGDPGYGDHLDRDGDGVACEN